MPRSLLLLIAGLAFLNAARAQTVGTCSPALGEAYLDVNQVRARILNNGGLFYRGGPYVFNVPQGSPSNAIFASGIWIGGYIGHETTPRVAGATYGPWEFWAGPLNDNGNPPPDCSAYDRLYSVYRADIEAYEATGAVTDDLREWPTGLGAPTLAPPNNRVDDDGDGEIDEAGEELAFDINVPLAQRKDRVIDLEAGERPAISGNQMIWWVMNDRGNTHERTQSIPIGLEVHGMAFAFGLKFPANSGRLIPFEPISHSTYYRYRIYHRGPQPLDRAYLGVWVDPDLGNATDDYVGSDTTLGIGYVYNADNEDEGRDGYGTPPPALGYDFFQGPIVPSPGDTARVSGRLVPGFKNLKMTTMAFYNGGGDVTGDPSINEDFYGYMDGRWRDGRPFTFGGNGRDIQGGGSTIPTRFMFSGDPVTNTGWTERNPDPINNSVPPISPGDRRFLLATGPFTINPRDFQEIAFGIVLARGTDNLESVAALRRADRQAQALFESNFQLAAPPEGPIVIATATDREVVLEWTNPASSNNYLDGYSQVDPLALADPASPVSERSYRFEGYDILQFTSEDDDAGAIIATYDLVNGVTRIVDGLPNELNEELARGTDSGIQHFHRLQNLVNYRTYHFGVRPYAYSATSFPRILRGEIARVSVTPARVQDDIPEASREAAEDLSEPDLIGIPSNALIEGRAWADIVNPGRIREATYTVEFYAIEVEAPASVHEEDAIDPAPFVTAKNARATATTYDIKRDGVIVFDGSATGQPAPLKEDVAVIDGLRFSILAPGLGIKALGTVSNSAGPIDPPDMAAFAFNTSGFPTLVEAGITPEGVHPFNDRPNSGVQQALSDARWGFHAGGASSINFGTTDDASTFLGRVLRNGNEERLGLFDWEMRFTQPCVDGINGTIEETDCLAWRAFEDELFVEVPFTLWRVGNGTFDDPSDDVRLIPIICENGCGAGTEPFRYDLGGDHPISGGNNDPHTDWIYWYLPEDDGATPGEQGYRDFFSGVTTRTGPEVLARTVLVIFNGGELPDVTVPLPEVGTTFRIYTHKRPVPGDFFTIDARGFGVTPAEDPLDVAAIGVVPNPYIGTSIYERSRAVDEVRFTNLPAEATIRVFTLHGTLIKTIRKNSPERFITWDLQTDNDLPIGSGVYLIHIEVPGAGEQTLKFAVVKKHVAPIGVLEGQ